MGQKWAGQLGNNFIIGTMGEGAGDPSPGEEVLDQVGKERVQCDVDKKDIINKTELKGVNIKTMHIIEEVRMGENFTVEALIPLLGNQYDSLKCLYTNAHGMGNQQNKLEVCVPL